MMMMTMMIILSISAYSILVTASPTTKHLCRPDQRDALLEFKSEFNVDKKGSAWWWRNNTDCCSWLGVYCDPKTGKVIKLNFQRRTNDFNGPLRSNSSLFRLHHLQSLFLDLTNLTGNLPDTIGNLRDLEVLRIASGNHFGKIPSSLGNLSYLTDLGLFGNGFTGELPDSLGTLKRLSSLEISDNKLSGRFPHVLLNLSSLTWMDLASNRFEGTLPSNMSSLSKLEWFDISGNSFSGSIPSSLFLIPSLQYIDLSRNHFDGFANIGNISSPRFIRKLFGLEELYLERNNMVVDLSLLSSHLKSVVQMDLSGNNLKIGSTLHLHLPSIERLSLSSCNIVEFPTFLQNHTRLRSLDISANRIEGQVPEWLWSLPHLQNVNISHNSFTGFEGPVGVVQRCEHLELLDISSNTFQHSFPLLPNSMWHFLGSDNGFSGEIPLTLCKPAGLWTLVLSNNNFSGSIPRCLENFNTSLSILHLRNNSLSGVFPEESVNVNLLSLDIGHNKLSGKLPKSLVNCTGLGFLNLEHNRFNDTFPSWLRLLPFLQMLVLRSNEFHGPISYPGPKLRIFDISDNRFNGVLPSDYFAGWTELSSVVDILDIIWSSDDKSVVVINKGLTMELVWSSFAIYKVIDLSGNRFEGGIPESVGLLKGLIVLNMSNNAFTRRIPTSLTNLTSLESLDLSHNALSGRIPPELGKLTFLARMNFSHNRLEGPIPQGTQIQSQDNSSFVGNLALCGVPLQEACGRKEEEAIKEEEEEEEDEEEVISWIAAAIGYLPGVFCGITIAHILASSHKLECFVIKIFHFFT